MEPTGLCGSYWVAMHRGNSSPSLVQQPLVQTPRKAAHFPSLSNSAWRLCPPKKARQLVFIHAHLLLQKPLLLHSLVQCQANPLGLLFLDDKLLGKQTRDMW